MRKRRYETREDEAEINMTPMLDIVFIMLIFFVVTTSFIKESGVDVSRPLAATAERKEHSNIMIGITENNEVWIDLRRVDARAVRANVERLHAENPGGGVVIQSDRHADAGLLVQVIDQSRAAGVDDVSIAAETAQE